jgi:hypothetical protein
VVENVGYYGNPPRRSTHRDRSGSVESAGRE